MYLNDIVQKCGLCVVGLLKFIFYYFFEVFFIVIMYMGFQDYFCGSVGNFVVCYEKFVVCYFVFEIGIGDENWMMGYQLVVMIDVVKISIIQYILCFVGRIIGVIVVVCLYSYYIVCFLIQCIGDINDYRQVVVKVFG